MSRVAVIAAMLPLGVGCAHGVEIVSSPPGATVYVDGEARGAAPVILEEEAGFFEERHLRVEKEGFAPLETTLVQDQPVWGVVGPALLCAPFTLGLSCLALGWGTRYAEAYEYRLSPLLDGDTPVVGAGEPALDPDATYPY